MVAGSFLCRTVVFSYQEEFRALARNPHPWYSGDVSTLDQHANLPQWKLHSPTRCTPSARCSRDRESVIPTSRRSKDLGRHRMLSSRHEEPRYGRATYRRRYGLLTGQTGPATDAAYDGRSYIRRTILRYPRRCIIIPTRDSLGYEQGLAYV